MTNPVSLAPWTHGLERTSPKGGPFLGRCIYCGLTDLPMAAALQPCDKAPSQDQQVLDALKVKP
jgi:hypothetical protein